MKTIKYKRWLKFLILLFAFVLFFSAASFSADVLDIGIGARSIGMARAYTSIGDDGFALFGNPAWLRDAKSAGISSMYGTLTNDVRYTLLGYAWPTAFGNFGIGYAGNQAGDIWTTTIEAGTGRVATLDAFSYGNDVAVAAYGNKINEKISYGAKLKYYKKGSAAIAGGEGSGASIDLGMTYLINDNLSTGIVASNMLGGSIRWTNGSTDIMNKAIDIGIGFNRGGMNLYGDLSSSSDRPLEIRLGSELALNPSLNLRLGIEQKAQTRDSKYTNYSAGVGYTLKNFRVDYAYHYDGLLAYNSKHFVSLSFNFPVHEKSIKIKTPSAAATLRPFDRAQGEQAQGTVTTTSEMITVAGEALQQVKSIKIRVQRSLPELGGKKIEDPEYTLLIKPDKSGAFEAEVPLKLGKNRIAVIGLNDKDRQIGAAEIIKALRLKVFKDIDKLSSAEARDLSCMGALGLTQDISVMVSSIDKDNFKPEKEVNRAEIAAFTARAKGIVAQKLDKPPFSDVPTVHWAAPYSKYAVDKKWMSANPDNTFEPNRAVSRLQAAVIVSRFAEIKVPSADAAGTRHAVSVPAAPFADIPINYWAAREINAARNAALLGYIKGYNFEPDKNITRAELFSMISKTKYIADKIKELIDFKVGY